MIITRTPMRMTLGGGGTDVLWYSKLRGGAWISAAIDKYVTVVLSEHEDKRLLRVSIGTTSEEVNNYQKLSSSIIRACLSVSSVTSGIKLRATSDTPPKSGLGGSGAFEVGLLNALYVYKRKSVSKLTLAKHAAMIEIERLKRPVGPQDQYIAALGGIRYFEIDRSGRVWQESLKMSANALMKLQANLLYFKTGMQHNAELVLGDQKKRSEEQETSASVITALDEIKALGQQVKKWLENGNIDEVGASFHTHWLIKKRLSESVSSARIDEWYEEGINTGALGGKIMGAGGGGWLVFYVNKNKGKFRERMAKIGLEERRVRFDWGGTKVFINAKS